MNAVDEYDIMEFQNALGREGKTIIKIRAGTRGRVLKKKLNIDLTVEMDAKKILHQLGLNLSMCMLNGKSPGELVSFLTKALIKTSKGWRMYMCDRLKLILEDKRSAALNSNKIKSAIGKDIELGKLLDKILAIIMKRTKANNVRNKLAEYVVYYSGLEPENFDLTEKTWDEIQNEPNAMEVLDKDLTKTQLLLIRTAVNKKKKDADEAKKKKEDAIRKMMETTKIQKEKEKEEKIVEIAKSGLYVDTTLDGGKWKGLTRYQRTTLQTILEEIKLDYIDLINAVNEPANVRTKTTKNKYVNTIGLSAELPNVKNLNEYKQALCNVIDGVKTKFEETLNNKQVVTKDRENLQDLLEAINGMAKSKINERCIEIKYLFETDKTKILPGYKNIVDDIKEGRNINIDGIIDSDLIQYYEDKINGNDENKSKNHSTEEKQTKWVVYRLAAEDKLDYLMNEINEKGLPKIKKQFEKTVDAVKKELKSALEAQNRILNRSINSLKVEGSNIYAEAMKNGKSFEEWKEQKERKKNNTNGMSFDMSSISGDNSSLNEGMSTFQNYQPYSERESNELEKEVKNLGTEQNENESQNKRRNVNQNIIEDVNDKSNKS